MKLNELLAELKRRHVYNVAIGYAVIAWLLTQIATQVFPFFDVPSWAVRLVVLLLVVGFPVALVLAWAFELTPEGIKRAEDVDLADLMRRRKGRYLAAGIVVVAAAALVVLTIQLVRKSSSSIAPAPTVAEIPVAAKSIAVLPFKPLAAQNRDEILENGMADTLIAKLSTIHDVVVPALASTRKYEEQGHDLLALGKLLHVRSVLEGTLQRVADRIRVSARLINVSDGASLWSGTFDEKFTDVFAVQDAIAQKVAAALTLHLSGEDQKQLTKRYTENTDAYQLYLKGRFYWNKYTEQGWRKSIEYFKQALGKDPNYAKAYAGLADSYSLMGELGFLPADEAFPKAQFYAENALKLDDALSDAHLSLGIVRLFYDEDLEAAEKELRRAKELNANNAQAYHFYAHYLQFSGRAPEAIAEIHRGAMLDPTNLIIAYEEGNAYYLAHQFEQSLAYLRRALELDPNFIYTSVTTATNYYLLGQYDQAVAELERTRAVNAEDVQWQGVLASAYAKSGRRADAEKIVAKLEEQLGHQNFDAQSLAYAYLALGDKDRALRALEYNSTHYGSLIWTRADPMFDPLRSEPRYAELLRRRTAKRVP